MMKIFLAASSFFVLHSAFCQPVIDVSKQDVPVTSNLLYTIGGEPFVGAKFVNHVSGSPYFSDQWMPAVVTDRSGHKYKTAASRLDLLQNQIHYLDSSSREFIASSPLTGIAFTDSDGKSYQFVHASFFPEQARAPKDGWYLSLCSGAASLYKQFKKILREQRPYGSATVEQTISTTANYMVLYKNKMIEVKKIKELPGLLVDEKNELEAFIKNNDDAHASMDDRMSAVVNYYNSLKEKNN